MIREKNREAKRDLFISKLIQNNIHEQTGHLKTIQKTDFNRKMNNTVLT